MKTTSTSANATSTPAARGPTRVPRLSIVEVAPFAAINSRAVRASDGSSATSAGRNSVEHTPTTDPATKTTTRSSMRAPVAETPSPAAPTSASAKEALAAEPIAEGRGERCDGGRREQPQQAGHADGRGAAVVVRKHAEGDEVRPLGRVKAPQASWARRMSAFRAAT